MLHPPTAAHRGDDDQQEEFSQSEAGEFHGAIIASVTSRVTTAALLLNYGFSGTHPRVYEAVFPLNLRLLQKAREPRSGDCHVYRLLQLCLADPPRRQEGRPGKLRPTAAMMAKVVPDLWSFERLYNEVIQYG